jgi:uncharacterized protein (TIRG00374 family)
VLTESSSRTSNGGWSSPAAVLFFRLLRVAVAGGLLWFAVQSVDDWGTVWTEVQTASWRWLAAAAALTLLDRVLMAWRWLALLRGIDANRPMASGALLRVFFVSTFVGTFLPGSVGGDAVRAYAATRHRVTLANAVASVAVDRLLGTVSVLLMAVFGLMLAGRIVDLPWLLPGAVGLSVVAMAATWALLFAPGIYERALRLAGAHHWTTLDRLARKFLAATSQYGHQRGLLGAVLSASVGVQVLRTLQTWCLGLALGLSVSGTWYFALVPIIVLIVLLPLSFAGLGTANAAFVALFGLAGVSGEHAFVLSLLFLALSVLGNLPGGLIVAVSGVPQREG